MSISDWKCIDECVYIFIADLEEDIHVMPKHAIKVLDIAIDIYNCDTTAIYRHSEVTIDSD
jgi:hypothetical protein